MPDAFVRVHRNSLAAIAHVEGVERDADGHQVVRLRGGGALPVSRRLAVDVARTLSADAPGSFLRPAWQNARRGGMSSPLRIATRKSRLALWQAGHVASRLAALHPGLEVSLVPS